MITFKVAGCKCWHWPPPSHIILSLENCTRPGPFARPLAVHNPPALFYCMPASFPSSCVKTAPYLSYLPPFTPTLLAGLQVASPMALNWDWLILVSNPTAKRGWFPSVEFQSGQVLAYYRSALLAGMFVGNNHESIQMAPFSDCAIHPYLRGFSVALEKCDLP